MRTEVLERPATKVRKLNVKKHVPKATKAPTKKRRRFIPADLDKGQPLGDERDRQYFLTLRLMRDKSNSELAQLTGMSHSTFCNWRKRLQDGATRRPAFNSVSKVCHALGKQLAIIDPKSKEIFDE